ncbi:MAG: hypothetical protein JSV82_05075 [Planctomycetota bacterium]|nr:MAG: hypothetical protein JSV82_05075 [Planctomycetota bacterium]
MRTLKLLVVVGCFAFCGCGVVEYFESEEPPYDEELPIAYNQTKLKESTSADVLAIIHRPEYDELLSQSKSVVASQGQKKKGYQIWFNMVSFDEDKLAAKRKYFFVVDEKGKAFLVGPRRSLTFNSEMVLEPDVLEEAYADENSRRIAILEQVLSNVRKDINEVAEDNKTLDICGMLINQTLQTVMHKMDESPVLASTLSDANGVAVDHISLGKGNIRMDVAGDIVNVQVRLGSLAWTLEDPFALEE